MNDDRLRPQNEATAPGREHTLGTWTRIYLHGCIAFLVVYALTLVVSRLVPLFGFVDSPVLAFVLAILAILVLPPLVGSIVLYGLLPLLGKKEAWRGLAAWDNKLVSEVSRAKQMARIVILNWPSEEVRTMGVLTATFDADEGSRQMAAVYVPSAPQTRVGYIRIVAVDDLEFTDWTLKQWHLYQLTFGSANPTRLVGESL